MSHPLPTPLPALDRRIRRAVMRRRGRRVKAVASALGVVTSRWLLLPLALAAWAVGRGPRTVEAGRGVASALMIEMLLASALKLASGRKRPCHGGDPDRWHQPGGRSMPSGHTANAVAAATVLAAATGSDAVLAAGLTAVVLTGISRVVADRHWASDVAAGLAVGYLSARLAMAMNAGATRDKRMATGTDRHTVLRTT